MGFIAEIKGKKLVITADIEEARPSASGKTMVIASSNGNSPTSATVNGKVVIVGFNAYFKP